MNACKGYFEAGGVPLWACKLLSASAFLGLLSNIDNKFPFLKLNKQFHFLYLPRPGTRVRHVCNRILYTVLSTPISSQYRPITVSTEQAHTLMCRAWIWGSTFSRPNAPLRWFTKDPTIVPSCVHCLPSPIPSTTPQRSCRPSCPGYPGYLFLCRFLFSLLLFDGLTFFFSPTRLGPLVHNDNIIPRESPIACIPKVSPHCDSPWIQHPGILFRSLPPFPFMTLKQPSYYFLRFRQGGWCFPPSPATTTYGVGVIPPPSPPRPTSTSKVIMGSWG